MDIICLSHLKWEETLFQRPQQLMLRMAASGKARVLYLGSCGTREYAEAILRREHWLPGGQVDDRLIYRNMPFLPLSRRFAFLRTMYRRLVVRKAKQIARQLKFQNPVLWIYYPAFIDHIDNFPCGKIVYDCMDLFRGFSASGRDIQEQENRLLRRADVVFTGGRSLQQSKAGINPHTYCFPSGVDYAHFHRAASDETAIPADIAALPRPILGYFGAVDERVDFALVNDLCRRQPHASIVFLGPLVGMERPPVEAANFHYLGKKRYAELPNYLKAFDVCLMPFAQSELTRHISPTKTPEYLAGGKPVVSTPVPDVVADYGDVVRIAADYEAFSRAIETALREHDARAEEQWLQKAQARSWDAIAAEMLRLVEEG